MEIPGKHSVDKRGLLFLFVVYILWGGTYLAIRVGVRDGSGFTPFIFGAGRAFIAGIILLACGAFLRQRVMPTRRELVAALVLGILLWTGGNGLVTLGETHSASGLAALIVASTPIWMAAIDAAWSRKMPSKLLVVSLLVGSAGIVVLSMPIILSGIQADFLSVIVIILAAICWSFGSIIQSRLKSNLSPIVNSAYQMIFGSIGFAIIAIAIQEPLPHPVVSAWLAWGYLVIFGSVIGFTAYIQALRLLPITLVSTYAYVNPVIAAALGWLILGETITTWTVGGAVLLLVGIAGVIRSQQKKHYAHACGDEAVPKTITG